MVVSFSDVEESVVNLLAKRQAYFKKFLKAKEELNHQSKINNLRLIIHVDLQVDSLKRIAKQFDPILQQVLENIIKEQLDNLQDYLHEYVGAYVLCQKH